MTPAQHQLPTAAHSSTATLGVAATKRACFFIATSWSDSPVSLHFRALANELAARGHRVVLLIDQRKTEHEDHQSNPAVYCWPSKRPTKLRDGLFLTRLTRRHRPDCLIANFGSVNVMLLVGWLMRVRSRVAWCHTLSSQIDLDWTAGRWLRKLLLWRKSIVYQTATNIVANTKATNRDLQETFGCSSQKCRVFSYGLPDPLAEPSWNASGPSNQREFVLPLICVGRLHPSKGQDVVIRAAHKLRESIPNFHIDFVGEGPFRDDYQKLIDDLGLDGHCTFQGRLSHQQVLERMAGACATIVPSRSEAFGLVNIESMAVGTPVVASAVGGIVELFTDGEEGFLVPPDDPPALADKLRQLLLDPRLRKTMGARARERFLAFEQREVIREQADWCECLVAAPAKELDEDACIAVG